MCWDGWGLGYLQIQKHPQDGWEGKQTFAVNGLLLQTPLAPWRGPGGLP